MVNSELVHSVPDVDLLHLKLKPRDLLNPAFYLVDVANLELLVTNFELELPSILIGDCSDGAIRQVVIVFVPVPFVLLVGVVLVQYNHGL